MKLSELKAMPMPELLALRDRLDKAIAAAKKRERAAARRALEKQARALGFSLDELTGAGSGRSAPGPARGKAASRPVGKPRYANPADPAQTWTGKGRRPAWIVTTLEAGAKLDDMAI